ncbi:MAG: methyl-accepting chemotaxis protein [Methanosarcinaceae archaeon]
MSLNIKSKLILYITVGVAIMLALMAVLIISHVSTAETELVEYGMLEDTKASAYSVDGELRENLKIATTIGNTMEEYESGNRDEVSNVLKNILLANPNIVGTYVGYEPNTFDNNDAEYANTAGYDSTGRFVPYWYRVGNGVAVEPLVDYDTSEYYQMPKVTQSSFVTEPYLYGGVLMVSYVSPIMDGGDFIGIAGVDAGLTRFDEEISDITIMDTGYAMMVSNSGVIISHPTKKNWIGVTTLYDLDIAGFTDVADKIEAGKEGFEESVDPVTGEHVLVSYYPIATGNYGMILVVPMDEVTAAADDMRNYLLMIILATIAVMGGIAFLIARSIADPISKLEENAKQMADGDLNVEFQAKSDDEIGQLANAMDTMRINIKDQIEKMDNILAGIVDPLFTTDEDLTITYFNKAAEQITGYSAADVVGKMKCADVINSSFCNTAQCAIKSCMASKDVMSGAETTTTTRDGTVIPVSVSSAGIFDNEGNPIGGVEILRDIREIKDQMGKMENILAGIVDPLFTTDKDLTITYFNKAAEQISGYSADEVVGKMKCADVVNAPFCNTAQCAIKSCMASKEVMSGAETTTTTRDGTVIPISVSSAGIFDNEGNPAGGVEIMRDIRDIKDVINNLIQVGDSVTEGDFSSRADVGEAKGDYRTLIDTINGLLDAIVVPLNDVQRVANAIAEGDLTKEIEVETKGDMKKFADAIDQMQVNLREIIGTIKSNAEKVAATSEEMSASSEEMTSSITQIADTVSEITQGAQDQSTKTEEVSRAMSDMTQSVQEVASNAQKAAENTSAVNDRVRMVGDSANDLMEKMATIKEGSDDTSNVIQDLDKKSGEIGEIVNLITNIADQTNLLALNAAIEAARAGEHGRGFAVVADEVRKLAEESGNAATQISDLIHEIQGSTERAVVTTQESGQHVSTGSESLSENVKSIGDVVVDVESLATMMQEIAAAAEEQSASIEEVTSSVEEVSAIAEESAAGTEETSAAVEEQTASMQEMSKSAQGLTEMAVELQEAVARFKVKET